MTEQKYDQTICDYVGMNKELMDIGEWLKIDVTNKIRERILSIMLSI